MMKAFDKMREDAVPSNPEQPTAEQLQSRVSAWKQTCKWPTSPVCVACGCVNSDSSLQAQPESTCLMNWQCVR